MKILVLSDTHAYLENARAVLARLQGKVDAVFHLGDHDDDAVALQQEFPKLSFHYVKGNNDYRVDTPSQKLVRLGGKNLLLTHGHKQRVYWNYDTISYWAEEQGRMLCFSDIRTCRFGRRAAELPSLTPGVSLCQGAEHCLPLAF